MGSLGTEIPGFRPGLCCRAPLGRGTGAEGWGRKGRKGVLSGDLADTRRWESRGQEKREKGAEAGARGWIRRGVCEVWRNAFSVAGAGTVKRHSRAPTQ